VDKEPRLLKLLKITMASQYTINSFLYGIDDYSFVEQYFRNRNITDFSYTKNTLGKKKRDDGHIVSRIIETINKQDEGTQQEIDKDFSEINGLSDDKGTENLLAEAKDQGVDIPINVQTQYNGYEIAFWIFNNKKNVFDGANAVQEFFTSGWKRVPVPSKSIDVVLDNKETLEQALKKYYQNKDKGLGKQCLVEVYPKKDRVYVVARISGRGANDVIPDEGQIKEINTPRAY
jgi:hypothetical protein